MWDILTKEGKWDQFSSPKIMGNRVIKVTRTIKRNLMVVSIHSSGAKNLGLVWLGLFHHSVFITHHPSPITHHSSLKISQFSLPCVWTLFSLQITQIFHHFLWEPQLITKSVATVVYPRWFSIPSVLISPSPLKTECLSQNPNPNPLFLRWSSLASPRQCVPSPFQKLPCLASPPSPPSGLNKLHLRAR